MRDSPARTLLRALLRRHRRTLLVGAAAGIGWQAAAAFAPLAVGRGVDAVGAGEHDVVAAWVGVLLVLGALEAMCAAVRHRQAITAYADTTKHLRDALVAAMLRQDDVARSRTDPGRVLSSAETDVARVAGFVDAVAHTVGYAVSAVVVAVLLVLLDPVLAACVLLPLLGVAAVALTLRGRVRQRWAARQEAVGQATSAVVAGLVAHEALAGLGAGPRVSAQVRERTGAVRRTGVAAARVDALVEPVVALLPMLGLASVLLVGGTRAAEGELPLGDVVTAAGWALFLLAPVRTLAERVHTAARAMACADRLAPLLDVPPRPAGSRHLPSVELELRGVRVGGALDDVSVHLPAGGRLAIVSDDDSGAVLAALLPRLRDPDGGSVLLGGVDLRALELDALRRAVVLVPRNPVLTGDTVADAVRDGAHEPLDDAAVSAALRVAAGDDLLTRGLDAPLGEQGSALSGGQRQRVALARALAARPQLLVLDDAAGALDALTEAELVDRLDAHLRTTGTGLLVVTSGGGLARLADRVLRLEGGRLRPDDGRGLPPAPVLLDAGP